MRKLLAPLLCSLPLVAVFAAAHCTAQQPVVPVENSAAASAAEMKAYDDVISGTDARFSMLPIAGGKFLMGSPASESGHRADESPQHEVEIEPFWMGKCEVTWDEFEVFMSAMDIEQRKAAGSEPTATDQQADAIARPTKPYTDMTFGMGKEGYPAICMTHYAARMYCQWLSAKTGRYYRLPTEAEWEYACRAGTTTAYSFGDDAEQLDQYAWYFDNSDGGYKKVGKKKPNPWGLHDMHGNVAEWTLDQYIPDFYAQFAGRVVKEPVAITKKLYPHSLRGGSWDDDAPRLRSAARRGSSKDWKQQDPQLPQSVWYFTDAQFVGFRIVRPLREPMAEERREIWDAGLDVESEGGRFLFPARDPVRK